MNLLGVVASVDGDNGVCGSRSQEHLIRMEAQAADRSDALTQKALMVANDTQKVSIEVEHLQFKVNPK